MKEKGVSLRFFFGFGFGFCFGFFLGGTYDGAKVGGRRVGVEGFSGREGRGYG